MNRVLMFWIALLLVFAGGMLIWTVANRSDDRAGSQQVVDDTSDAVDARPKLTEFELLDQTGRRVNSTELAGEVWAGSFFFALCPSTCYNQNIKLQELNSKYADRGLKLVSITCDPGNDTPVALTRYAGRFNAQADTWKFLTPADGDIDYIRRIGNDFFRIAVGPETHTDRVVLFDRQGDAVGSYSVLNPKQFRELDEQIERVLSAAVEPSNAAKDDDGKEPVEQAIQHDGPRTS